jgi:hypothetical protein
MIRDERLLYPEDHIEIDNRLSWFLGKLDEKYGDNAFYVHLRRNDLATAQSLAKRIGQKYRQGIMGAYEGDIVMRVLPEYEDLGICWGYVETVNTTTEMLPRQEIDKMRF